VTGADAALLGGAGFLAGTVNAVAGGGSLISFPALLAAGYATVPANVTNSIAVLPGYLGGTVGYRRELEGQRGRARRLGAVSVLGAAAGAGLLLLLPASVFEAIVPFLVLGACALLALSPRLGGWSAHARRPAARDALVFVAAVYGGYFGAGLGIALLAILELGLDDDLQRLNALKGLLSLVVGVAAAVVFALLGPVHWGAAGLMAATSLIGGRAGVAVARRLPARALRTVVILFGVGVAIRLLVS
jgi:uncharacterized membrane protein YfcA